MKQTLTILLILSWNIVFGQWSQVINTITRYPPSELPVDSVFSVNAPSRTAIGEGVLVPVTSGGGAELPYYELIFRADTDGASTINYTEVSNTFPGTWTPGSAGGGAIVLNYSDTGVDFYDFGDQLYSASSSTYHLVENQMVFVNGVVIQDPQVLGWLILKSGTNGVLAGTGADLENGIINGPLQIMLRWYHD